MKSFFAYALIALGVQVSAFPHPVRMCGDWSVTLPNTESTFTSNEQVTLRWDTRDANVQYISSIGLFSAKTNEFLHTQFRSYPGVDATDGELTFALTVPLCLQREGEYYLQVYGSTPAADSDCSLRTQSFKLTPDPSGDYSACSL
ncbi:hypothetical protein K493DRAFT_316453 [Basidiobolus meristosporus CBS 931.73]|uniref:Ser-Thr-rich glycosyl-phosphatidyl-inositol-anchored membrane family-domain-containing protein n=1 Tax=Basidiobolus meristosporus CBS 931.73 TaxID=1314790 RepID=A0A1Y1Y3P0_9FUNG|nr:hypothetical protein K493DRAFT_316453 [Basidiobolus meristosporus CBS 931.73]|eukprot:ORX92652.1 hypothetical protein K493DRAFT_316453 [Basidiobolus meristosporus CBS 931.73]